MNPMVLLLIFALCILGAYIAIFIIHKKFMRNLKDMANSLTKLRNNLEQMELHMKVINNQIDSMKR